MRLMSLAILIAVVLVGSAALAAGAVPDPLIDPAGWAQSIVAGFGARDWLLVGGAVVLGVTALLRWQRARLVGWAPWLGTKAGGYALAFAVAALTSLAGALVGHLPWLEAIKQALLQGFVASGLWEAIKDRAGAGR